MRLKTKKYDVANYLDTDEIIARHLDSAFASGEASRVAEALGDVARAVTKRMRRRRSKTRKARSN